MAVRAPALPAGSTTAFVGLGGNLGDAAAAVCAAVASLGALPQTRLLAASRLYRTPAWGLTSQPDFVNAVAMLETRLVASELLEALLGIERAAGRERGLRARRWGPRTLDLDLLMFGDQIIDAPGLQVPHPHLHERAFVLVPLGEVAPSLVIPGRGLVQDLLAAVATDDVQALG